MSIQLHVPSNEEEYIACVSSFSALVDAQFSVVESWAEKGDFSAVSRTMPSLISLVNVIGYFRGQDSVFLEFRPQTGRQGDLYKNEDAFETRLQKLIDAVMQSNEKEMYLERLQNYFVRARSNQKPTAF